MVTGSRTTAFGGSARPLHAFGPGDIAPLAAKAAGLLLISLCVANCSGPQATKRGKNYGVAASPRVVAEGQPVPKGGGRDMTGKPYVVGGRTYVPHGGPGYDREGWASWYGAAFHGRLTANGEVFDRGSIAAAHPTLPLPSYVRVTNTINKRSMIVRVNDRGPYEHDRVIDVSEQVADSLGFKRGGTSRVRVQYVGRASVHGSDDSKLLATLRTDGSPASSSGTGERTMLASLRDEGRPAEPPRTGVATKLARVDTSDDLPRVSEAPRDPVRGSDGVTLRSATAQPPGRPPGLSPASRPIPPEEEDEDAPRTRTRTLPIKPLERAAFAEIY